MKTTDILFSIDQQKGFERFDISQDMGGCLYVPEGKNTISPMARLFGAMRHGIKVFSQDNHPDGHISFMENHPGVMEHRKQRLRAMGHAEETLDDLVLDVMTMAFDNIRLKKSDGSYRAVAFQDGNFWRAVETNQDGYITAIRKEEVAPQFIKDGLVQTLWRKHCTQGSESALLDQVLMATLPERLAEQIRTDSTSPVLIGHDEAGNTIYVTRKGMRRDMDSYGIATENDQVSTTMAPAIFAEIAEALQKDGVTHTNIFISGLATNFCVEYSHNDLYKFLLPELTKRSITSQVHFINDASAGIPLTAPDGAWPDLDAAPARMAAMGTKTITSTEVMRYLHNPRPTAAAQLTL